MRKLSPADFERIMEALGYFREPDGLLVSSGAVTGPKAMWAGPMEPDEYLTVDELIDFLTSDRVSLLEEEVREKLDELGYL